MKTPLFSSVEHLVLVLLRTHMTDRNRHLLTKLCDKVFNLLLERAFAKNASRRPSAVIMLNGTVMLLHRWYLMVRGADRDSFAKYVQSLVEKLEEIREQLFESNPMLPLNEGPGVFYASFKRMDFRTRPIR